MRQVSLAITEKTTQATQATQKLLNYTKMENSHFKCLNKYYIQTNETLVSIRDLKKKLALQKNKTVTKIISQTFKLFPFLTKKLEKPYSM